MVIRPYLWLHKSCQPIRQEDLKNSRVNIGILTGSMKTAERREVLEGLASGNIDLLIGTHSVANDDGI